MRCIYTLETGRHKRQADITLWFEYIFNLKTATPPVMIYGLLSILPLRIDNIILG